MSGGNRRATRQIPEGPVWIPSDTSGGDWEGLPLSISTLQGLVDQAFTDPAHITAATFDQYLIGNAKTLFDAALYNEKQAGRYYQGTPDLQRVRVASINLSAEPKTVMLTSCPLASATDPSTEYEVSTGKPVPAGPAPKVPPPYGHAVKVVELSGQWLVETFTIDSTKTCKP